MAKERLPIDLTAAADVLFASDRTCCVCTIPGKPAQIHHIDEDPGNNAPDNLAVLCLDCHNDTQIRGGFARKLDAAQVVRYREDWYQRVRARRAEADRLAVSVMAPEVIRKTTSVPPDIPRDALLPYIQSLPQLRLRAYHAVEAGRGYSTAEMADYTYKIIDVMKRIMVNLAIFYPDGHFDNENPGDYFTELIASRFRWHRSHHATEGHRWSGTIVGTMTGASVISDVEQMVADMVGSLVFGETVEGRFDWDAWRDAWRKSPSEGAHSLESTV